MMKTIGLLLLAWVLFLSVNMCTGEVDEETEARANALFFCEQLIIRNLNYPSTYDSKFTGLSVTKLDSGILHVRRRFTAKNAFGLEIEYEAQCVIDGDEGVVSIEKFGG